MDASFLQILWFILIAVLLIGYYVLDGFDLGIGVLYPFFAKNEKEKATMRASVGPVWDGNEVWLLTAGGALFAAFPPAYATTFSGFYLAIMLVLFGLIARAVSIEFRAHDPGWSKLWDICFFVGSLLPALLFGVALGNIVNGIPLDINGDYTGSFFALLNPFSLLVGVLGLFLALVQGANWLAVKVKEDTDLYNRAVKFRKIALYIVGALALVVTVMVFTVAKPELAGGIPAVLRILFAVVFVGAWALALYAAFTGKDLLSFIGSSVSVVGAIGLLAATLFPRIVPATDDALSITVANAASSDLALTAMAIIAAIGVPLVLIYHVIVYRIFWGKLEDDDLHY